MPERDGYIAGVPCWIDRSYPDPEPVLKFYAGLFGWEFNQVSDPGGERYFIASVNGGSVGAIGELPANAPAFSGWNTYIAVDNADAVAPKLKAAGGEVLVEAFDVGPAGRTAIFKDPEGAVFSVWQAGTNKGAQRVNEHGAVNFNILLSADSAKAKAFYGAVFGWETLAVPGADEFWTLPAYGDHLEELAPGTRKRNAEMGVPGFENVLAALRPADPGMAPHWGVTFGVDDANAAARTAESLGGKVITAPADGPYTRYTVLADPLGGWFGCGQFVPENKPALA
ncbi:MAG: VOC family protein [Solirubrobacterales bacterium]|nr:VOC family protein [Solirubrobacterales bacterium]